MFFVGIRYAFTTQDRIIACFETAEDCFIGYRSLKQGFWLRVNEDFTDLGDVMNFNKAMRTMEERYIADKFWERY